MINTAVVVSDLHCGSSVGLAHPESPQEEGNIVGFGSNHHQAWLWDCWTQAIDRIVNKFGADYGETALIVNGDAVDGTHHRNREMVAASIEEHTEIARMCLEPLRSLASKVFFTKGTQCHTEGMENKLAHDMGAESGKARNKWLIDINGTLIDAAHHIMTASRVYLEATQLSVNLYNAKLNYLRTNQRVPDLFLRGHRHVGGVYNDGSSIMAVTGGWQFLNRWSYKVVTDSIPRPSIITLDWRGKARGELPIVEQITFSPPQDAIIEI